MNDIHQSTNYFKWNLLQQLSASREPLCQMAENLSVIHNNSINYEVFEKSFLSVHPWSRAILSVDIKVVVE